MRGELRLASGDTDGLVAELAALAEAEPLRERPRALLMAALAAAGRQAEALRVFDDFRRLLGDELGIEPSPVLAAQHADLLGAAGDAAWAPATRLPAPPTSLVGRDSLVAEVTAMVEDRRLVTMVGPGGVGKTRLVVEVGQRLRAARGDRPVVLCELATAVEESAVDVVAAALAIDARPGVRLAEHVTSVLGDSEVVVLLDNCEHVLDPIAELAAHLLTTCPNVTLVATSRERLRVPGEQLCAVPPLVSEAQDAPAVRLFVERARAVVPTFDPDAAELACVAEIVRRLDGLPSAVELAAARLHTHTSPRSRPASTTASRCCHRGTARRRAMDRCTPRSHGRGAERRNEPLRRLPVVLRGRGRARARRRDRPSPLRARRGAGGADEGVVRHRPRGCLASVDRRPRR